MKKASQKKAKAAPIPVAAALPKAQYVKVTDINAKEVWLNPALVARLAYDPEQCRVEVTFADGQMVRIKGTVEDLLK